MGVDIYNANRLHDPALSRTHGCGLTTIIIILKSGAIVRHGTWASKLHKTTVSCLYLLNFMAAHFSLPYIAEFIFDKLSIIVGL